MVSSEDNQKISSINWKSLENEVDNAIKKGCCVNFDSKTINECRYIQKYIETISNYDDALSLVLFLGAISIASLYQFFSTDSYYKYIFAVIGLIFVYYTIKFLCMIMKIKYEIPTRRKIILDAEKRILSEGDT